MSFGLIILAFFAIPIWLVRRGYYAPAVGLGMLAICFSVFVLGAILGRVLPEPIAFVAAFLAYAAMPLGLLSLLWCVIAVITTVRRADRQGDGLQ